MSTSKPRALARALSSRRGRWLFAALLAVAILVPYWRLTTMQGIVITDDIFTSDIANGEFPGHVAIGQSLKAGELPLWTTKLCNGYPLLPGGGADPMVLATFGTLSPKAAVNCLMLLVLIIAALGAFAYARTLGASRAASLVAGLAYAYSGYMVCQLKHLAIVGTVCWFPVALTFLERAMRAHKPDPDAPRPVTGAGGPNAVPISLHERYRWLIAFACIYSLQVLAGFPQSAYICALVYGGYGLARAWPLRQLDHRGLRLPGRMLCALAVAGLLGVGLGMVQLLPLWELGTLSDRANGMGYEWASHPAYWPRNVWNFVLPYINGDIGNGTYIGQSIFWEDYGYVGLLTLVLALAAIIAGWRRPLIRLWVVIIGLSYLMVLGPATPVFRLAFELVPGMSMFRFPTRFLFVVDLGLAVLGAVGLTYLEDGITRWWRARRPRVRPLAISTAVVAILAADLVHAQMRQNPIADADTWLSPPRSAERIRAEPEPFRIFSLDHYALHVRTFQHANGWEDDLTPYIEFRELLQPNLPLVWGLSTAECYAGIHSRWQVDLWGSHNRLGMVQRIATDPAYGGKLILPFLRTLELYNVRYLLTMRTFSSPRAPLVGSFGKVHLYRLTDTLPRAFVVPYAVSATTRERAFERLLAPDFDPRREVIVHDSSHGGATPPTTTTTDDHRAAHIRTYRNNEVIIDAETSRGGFLVLADAWYPGWKATIDGQPTPVLQANFNQRAVELPPGEHHVRFYFSSEIVHLGAALSAISLALILLAWVRVRPSRRRRATTAPATQETG